MTQFRLAAQPGLVRSNSHIKTVIAPQVGVKIVHDQRPPQRRSIAPKYVSIAPPPPAAPMVRATPAPISPAPIVPAPPIRPPAREIIKRTVVQARQTAISRSRDEEFNRNDKDNVAALRGKGRGRVLVIVACGPSIKEVALEKLQGIEPVDIMTVNKPDARIFPTKYWIFCDQTQHTRNIDLFDRYTGTLINAWTIGVKHPNQIMVKVLQGKGFSKNLCLGFHIGRSTTYAAMQVAYWMGYERVYIFGCDMSAVNGQMHHYGKNPDVDDATRARRFQAEAENYAFGAQLLSNDERQRYVFCSTYNPFEFVGKFQRASQVEAVDMILSVAQKLRESNGKV